ncbi:MAG: DivIVA domain-containing protein [Clostridia bacterium]|nr:DivIVA domain-containing protein [Clostridia bacterium]
MLTPAKIKNHHFEASGRNAYKAESVDSFFEEVAESYEQMFRENGEMYKKISLLAERLEEYRNDEDNIRNALLTAQRMAEKIQREAAEKAEALLTAAQTRADEENARIDAASNEMMAKATYQAKAIIEEAQKQAEKLVYDATYESKAAAVSARDAMIKEEAALEMMKAEVTKFKSQILEMYSSQLSLIEQLPEIAYAVEEEEEIEVEIVEIPEEPAEEAPVEEAVIAAEIIEEAEEEAETAEEPEEDEVDVETLQQMIEETEDTDAEDEIVEDIDEDEEEYVESTGDFVIPAIDEETDEELDEIVENYIEETKPESDIYFANATRKPGEGFKVALGKISAYEEDEADEDDEIDEDELDDDEFDDDDSEGGLAAKFKGFFRK